MTFTVASNVKSEKHFFDDSIHWYYYLVIFKKTTNSIKLIIYVHIKNKIHKLATK